MSNELNEIPAPIGDFIIKNADGVILNGGGYYHYTDVCKLLTKMRNETRIDTIKLLLSYPFIRPWFYLSSLLLWL